jgi:hypothetical protein
MAILLIALVASPIAIIAIGGMRAQREDQRDILTHGKAAVATVISALEIRGQRTALVWKVTIEYPIPDRPSPVRVDLMVPEGGWTTKANKRVQDLTLGDKVAVHYREKWPSIVVVDDLVGRESNRGRTTQAES